MRREELLQASTLAEHQGIWDPPHQVPEAAVLCGQDGMGGGDPRLWKESHLRLKSHSHLRPT